MISRDFLRARLGRLVCLIGLLFAIGLTGCSGPAGAPPTGIVSQAVAVQAQAANGAIWQALTLGNAASDNGAPAVAVKDVKVRQVRLVQVASAIAYEAIGTYQYTTRYAQHPKEDSEADFNVVLQPGVAGDSWQLLNIESTEAGRPVQWSWEPLMR